MTAIDVMTVRADDWPLWRRLRRSALADAPDAFGSTLADWSGSGDTEMRWRQRLLSVPLNVVFRIDAEPVGMVSAYEPASSTIMGARDVDLIGLWVAPAGRGRGVGDAAMRHVLSWAADRGADGVVLSVRVGNAPARRLYTRHGFHDAGPSPDDRCELLLRRPIGRAPAP